MTAPASGLVRATRTTAATSRPRLAALGYVAAVGSLLFVAGGAVSGLLERRATLAEVSADLDRLQGRSPGGPEAGSAPRDGAPLLDGPTLTIAGADLMQRLATAVAAHGGQIVSSRVALSGTPYGPDFIAVEAMLAIAQPHLQALLYDLEAGMPFLFVGRLSVDAGADDEMRVALTVYGQWRGPR